MPAIWSFRCYISPSGTDETRRWHNEQSKQVRAKFLQRLTTLAQLPFEEWREPLYKNLHGDCAGLGEIRFKANNVQHRPLGFRSGEREFTILFCAIEKSNRFNPRNACEIALNRKYETLNLKDRTNALWLALE